MVYTSYEMIGDCRAGRPEGWIYFLTEYVPVVRALLAHYFPERSGDPGLMERVLRASRTNLFAKMEPLPERAFVAELRQWLLGVVEAEHTGSDSEESIELETLTAALEPLTLTEKLAVWLEGMRYGAEDAGRMLRMSAATVEQIRGRGAEMIRGSVDVWRRSILADSGPALGRAAGGLSTAECLPAKAFFDVIDGRTPWRGREDMERHVRGCWHCLDHYCRLLETVDVLRRRRAADAAEVEQWRRLLGIEGQKKMPFWKRAG
jgi:hypothetical protein